VEHPVHRITSFEVAGPYRLRPTFEDGLIRTIDLRPVLEGERYGALRDLAEFNSVSLDQEVHTLVWPNRADFDPALLHDWPQHEPGLIALAHRWVASGRGEKTS
jgi:hypothetical protein